MSALLRCQAILASAGSGKTYTISGRYIALLAVGAEPDEIFASTFTRKAAGEILSRVLRRLAEGALDDAAAAELEQQAHDAGLTGVRIDRAVCRAQLVRLVRQLHRLDIGTLDSFFVRAATCYALELGLPANWSATENDSVDDERVRIDAVTGVLTAADGQTLATLRRAVGRGPADRSVHESMMSLVGELTDRLRDATPAAWRAVPNDATGQMTRQEIEDHIAALPEDDVPLTKAGKVSTRWRDPMKKVMALLRGGRPADLLESEFLLNVCEDSPTYYGVAYPASWLAWLRRTAAHAAVAVRIDFAERLAAMHGLAVELDRQYRAAQRAAGVYRFTDATDALASEQGELLGQVDVYYRLDARLRHILLDEFQDTSRRQWAALSPLLDEAAQADGDRAVLVVADPKQSIYGWRGGEPRITDAIVDRYALREREGGVLSLPKSYRSSQVVLDGVDAVFSNLARCAMLGEYDETVTEWLRSYTKHDAAKTLPGFVHVTTGPMPENRRAALDGNEAVHAAKRIQQIALDAPSHTVGVLVRRNSVVARLRYELHRLGVASSEEGGNPLTDSPAVASLMALLQLADHTGDTIAGYHVAATPLGRALGVNDHGDVRGLRAVSFEVRRQLAADGYGKTISALAERIAPACDERDLNRLLQLIAKGHEYDGAAPTLRPSDFARLIRRTKVEDPTTARVRVMTIHKSKGLEFDIVVLPDLEQKLIGGSDGLVAERSDPLGPITALCPSADEKVRRLVPEIDRIHRAADAERLRDSLSGLYVAMTRARHALHAIVRPAGRSDGSLTFGKLLRDVLATDADPSEPDTELYEHGDPAWCDSAREEPATEPSAAAHEINVRLAAPGRRRSLPRHAPSQLAGGGVVRIENLLGSDGGGAGAPAAMRGTVMHQWCELIEWLDDGLPGRDALASAAREAGYTGSIDAWADEFETMWRGDVAAELHRASYADGAGVWRERRFAVRLEHGILQGAIDRVTVERDAAGVPSRAVVHDYKTDRVSAGDGEKIVALVAHYTPQLHAYRAAAAQMLNLPESAVAARLLLLEADAVVEV